MMKRQELTYWHHFLKKRHGGEESEAGEWPVTSSIDANKRNNGMKPGEKSALRIIMRQSSHSAGYKNKKSEKRGESFILNRGTRRVCILVHDQWP